MNSIHVIRVSLAAVVALAAQAAEMKVPLAIEYPKAAYEGTPKPFDRPNLVLPPEREPKFLVTRRTTLLSRGRPVSGSDSNPIFGELSFVTDGDKTGANGAVVELGPGPQWVQIDLGVTARIHAIGLWHFHAEPRVYHDVVVQISSDPTFARKVITLFNNDHDNSTKLGRGRDREYIESRYGRLIDAQGAVGRYVRLTSNGNTADELNHYCEVEIFGEPANPAGK